MKRSRNPRTGRYVHKLKNGKLLTIFFIFYAWTAPMSLYQRWQEYLAEPLKIGVVLPHPTHEPPQAQARENREELQASSPAVLAQPVVEHTTTATITAYSCGGLKTEAEIRMNCPSLFSGEPKTANGTTPIPYKTMACDRANMERVFEIEGIGKVKCTDTGSAIQGPGRFDLYVETVEEARQWGVQQRAYTLVEEGQ